MRATLMILPLLLSSAFAATVRFDPLPLEVGQPGRLTIRVDGDDAEAPPTPRARGLEIQLVGRSSQIRSLNGALSVATEFIYQVTAERPGEYTIPALDFGHEQTPEVPVQVVAAGAEPPPQAAADAPDEPKTRTGFLRFYLPDAKGPMRVGETTPITVRAYFRADGQVTIEGRPEVESTGFTVDGLEKLDQGERTVAGVRYLTATWKGTLTAVQEGEHQVTARLPATVRWRGPAPAARPGRRRASPFDDPFFKDAFGGRDPFAGMLDDPFFQRAFEDDPFGMLAGGRLQEKSLKLQAHRDVTVEGLPAEGRPATFDGAVGQFSIEAHLDDDTTAVGEPRTLTITVSGTGNFDQVRTPGLASSDALRAYPVGTGEGPDGRRGAKVFTQPIVARAPGTLTVPPVEFTYFDPQAGAYQTIATAPLTLRATGEATPVAAAPGPAPPDAGAAEAGSIAAPWTRPNFWLLPLGALALSLGLVGWTVARRHLADLDGRAQRAERAAWRRMRRAARREAPLAFLEAARSVAQQRLGRRWGIDPSAITGYEIAQRLPAADPLRALFDAADRAQYGGGEIAPIDYPRWQRELRAALAEPMS